MKNLPIEPTRHAGSEPVAMKDVPVPMVSVAIAPPDLSNKVGKLERLPKWLNLVPMVAQWAWLSLVHRSITLPSCANPHITAGGLVGEGKMEYLNIMGPRALLATARTTSVEVFGMEAVGLLERAMHEMSLTYPVVLKPDLGWCGFGVRRIHSQVDMTRYVAQFPKGERLILQEWLADEGEAGLFYMRDPGQPHGQLIGVLLRHFPRVRGDGIHTVGELMAADVRACRLGQDGASEPCCDVDHVPLLGEVVRIASVGSTRVGGGYEDGSRHITAALTHALDAIALDMQDFHVGRFDVKFADLAALERGRFRIIEVNGAGSEAVHAWDPRYSLRKAYGIVFAKQRRLFAIGQAMRARGHRSVGWFTLLRHWQRQQALIEKYPPSN
jgi:hypothetical protein